MTLPSLAQCRLDAPRGRSRDTSPDVAYVFGAAGNAAHLWRRSGTPGTKSAVPSSLSVNQAWYDWYVAATPDNNDQVYLGAIDTFRGDLSGTTWTLDEHHHAGRQQHPSRPALPHFSPGNSKTIYAGNDGGIYRSANSGSTWKVTQQGSRITEIEYMASDPTTSTWLMAGTQDNGTIRFTGRTIWDHIADGDGGDCGVNEQNPNIVYHSLLQRHAGTLEQQGQQLDVAVARRRAHRCSIRRSRWRARPSRSAPSSLVVTRNGGAPWTTVPLGLSANEVSTAMRAIDANTLLIGTNFGRMLRMSWTGASWSKTALASPVAKYISCIAVDPSNPQRFG